MWSSLSSVVRKFISGAKRNPGAVTGAALDELQTAADGDFSDSFAAMVAPVAPYTWMVRGNINPADPEAQLTDLAWPGECEIIGVTTSLVSLATAAPDVLPPEDAFDVRFEIDQKALFTARADQAGASGASRNVVSLPFLKIQAPRLLGIVLRGTKPTINMTLQWSVPATVRTYRNYGPTQISVGFMIRDLTDAQRSQ